MIKIMDGLNCLFMLLDKRSFFAIAALLLFGFAFVMAIKNFQYDKSQANVCQQKSVIRFWLFFIRQKPLQFGGVILFNLFYTCRGMFLSFAFGEILTKLSSPNLRALDLFVLDEGMVLILFYLMIGLISLCMDSLSELIMSRLIPWFTKSVREYYFEYLCDYGYGYMSGSSAGVSKIIEVVGGSVSVIQSMLSTIIPTVIFGFISIIWFFKVDAYFGALYFLWFILQTSISFLRFLFNRENSKNTYYYKQLLSRMGDTFSKMSIIKMHKSEGSEKVRFRGSNDLDIGSYREKWSYNTITNIMLNSIYYIFFNFIFVFKAALEVTRGSFDIGTFTQIIGSARFLSFDIWNSCKLFTSIAYEWHRVKGAIDDLSMKNEVSDTGTGFLNIKECEGSICFKNISFGYDSRGCVLEGLNLTLKLGGRYALVGESGCGKSSLVHLLMRFYDPAKGEIAIDDTDIRMISLSSLRQNIALVPQLSSSETSLNIPIFMTIAYGCKEMRDEISAIIERDGPQVLFAQLSEKSQKRIIAGARTVKLDSIIRHMPYGYDSVWGENAGLSGGQRQRLLLAQALVKNSNAILILDECTSALDVKAEAEILQIIKNLPSEMTIINISHRLETIMDQYTIVMFKNKKVAEMGAHQELIKNKGPYYRLVTKEAFLK